MSTVESFIFVLCPCVSYLYTCKYFTNLAVLKKTLTDLFARWFARNLYFLDKTLRVVQLTLSRNDTLCFSQHRLRQK